MNIHVPIEDVLDLHTFNPQDVKILLNEYFYQAARQGFTSVRVIHGKGKGVLRRITVSVCEKHDDVVGFKTADENRGGWGSTVVELKKRF